MSDAYCFGPYRLDLREGWLFRGKRKVFLRPKTFALLEYLVLRAGQLVGKNELLSTLWPDVVVDGAGLAVCVHELRDALRDDSQNPRFIETHYRRGYRFVAPVNRESGSEEKPEENQTPEPEPGQIFVGRAGELSTMLQCWRRVLDGQPQILFVIGEAGVGKTTLVDRFAARITASTSAMIGRGQCVEFYGGGEAYLPILDAMGRICRSEAGRDFKEILLRHAPTWATEMPGLVEDEDVEAMRIAAASATRARMMRELAVVLEFYTATRPLVLVLEDLHLADNSTLDLIGWVSRRVESGRLLIVATARSGEERPAARVLWNLVADLARYASCVELRLDPLGKAAVAEYVRRRLGAEAISIKIADKVFCRTEGNALFMVNLVDHLVARGDGSSTRPFDTIEVPETVRKMVEKQVDLLDPEDRRLLEDASVAGLEFTPGMLETAGDEVGGEAEERCEQMARNGSFLRRVGASLWPDGTVGTRFMFRHALYQEILYDRVSTPRRVRLHRKIAERLEAGWAGRAGEVAGELAVHFQRGGDCQRAARYLEICAQTALNRSANDDAIAYAEAALAAIASLPEHSSHPADELRLRLLLGSGLMARWGMAAPAVRMAYRRARELVEQIGHIPSTAPVLLGLVKYHLVRSELDEARSLSDSCLEIAQSSQDPDLLLEAHVMLAAVLYSRGNFIESLANAEKADAIYDPGRHRLHALNYGLDPGVVAKIYAGMSLWRMGFADRSRKKAAEAMALAEKHGHSHTVSTALTMAASIYERCRDWPAMGLLADKLVSYSAEKELPFWHGWGTVLKGQARLELADDSDGASLVQSGLAELEASGGSSRQAEIASLLVQVRRGIIGPSRALEIARLALETVKNNGEATDQAEIERTIGVLLLQERGASPEAESCKEAEGYFLAAIETARRQGALAFELRATMDIARLWMLKGQRAKARKRMIETVNRFTEGFDIGDLREARSLVEQLAA